MILNRQKLPAIAYITISILLLLALFVTFDTYVLHMKVEMAVVASPLDAISAPIMGQISAIYVKPGSQVKLGDSLLKIENIELEKELRMAQLDAENAKLNVRYYENLIYNEEQRLKVYQNVGSSRLASAKAAANIAQEEFNAAKKNQLRMSTLHQKNYVSESDWDFIIAKYRTADDKLKSALALKELEQHSLNSVEKGFYFTGNKLEGRQQDLNAELETAKSRLTIQQERVSVFEQLKDKLIIKAPYNGTILQILKSVGNNTDNIKPLFLIENATTNKSVIGYLTQQEALHLNLNATVKIYVPALNLIYHGTLTEINRTASFIDELKAQYHPRDMEQERTVIAMVTINSREQINFNKTASVGMPVILYFHKNLFA